jgi:sulfate adenylyltransferase
MKNIKLFEESLSYPTHTLTDRQNADLELILVGGFYPLQGFLNQDDYESVLKNQRLSTGELWPIPIVLDTNVDTYKIGQKITLLDKFNAPQAILTIESIYRPDKQQEAKNVYGTEDNSHFGVDYLINKTKDIYLGGKVESLYDIETHYNEHNKLTPKKLREVLANKERVVAFQTRNPIHRAHYELIRDSAEKNSAHILIHPAVGQTKDGDIDPQTRIKIYEHIVKRIGTEKATLSLLPIAMRMAGPREALWHAIIRKSYGATHFIVGRDHAGPGKDKSGNDFYDHYDAQKLAQKCAEEIGIKIVASKELVYLKKTDSFIPYDEVPENAEVLSISGTDLRKKLKSNEEIPEWFSFKEVVSELRNSSNENRGLVLAFTGLSSSGKSTIAGLLIEKIKKEFYIPITFLDGDEIRSHLSYGLGFSKEDRDRNVMRVGFVTSEIAKHGGVAVTTLISPYQNAREANRKIVSLYGNYTEIYVKTSIEECSKRDVKGLYKKSLLGLIKGVTGVDDPYEIPKNPDITIDTSKLSAEEASSTILDYIITHQLIKKSNVK